MGVFRRGCPLRRGLADEEVEVHGTADSICSLTGGGWHISEHFVSAGEKCGTNPIPSIIQPAGDTGFLEYRRVPSLSKRCRLCEESAFRINIHARRFLDLCSASAADHD